MASRSPAVSTRCTGMPPSETVSVTRSRVVPGIAVTMARSRSTNRLNSEDLPTLGRPTIASVSPAVHNPSPLKRAFQHFERNPNYLDSTCQISDVRHDIHIVFGKIDPGLKHRNQLNQLLFRRLNPPRQRAAHLSGGHARLVQRLRLDQVPHRFGLREVNSP